MLCEAPYNGVADFVVDYPYAVIPFALSMASTVQR